MSNTGRFFCFEKTCFVLSWNNCYHLTYPSAGWVWNSRRAGSGEERLRGQWDFFLAWHYFWVTNAREKLSRSNCVVDTRCPGRRFPPCISHSRGMSCQKEISLAPKAFFHWSMSSLGYERWMGQTLFFIARRIKHALEMEGFPLKFPSSVSESSVTVQLQL